jgi:hypothetical protein
MSKDNQDLAIEALEWFIDMKDDDLERFEKLPGYFQNNIRRLVFYAREYIEENMTYLRFSSSMMEYLVDNREVSGSSPLGTTTEGKE